MIRLICLLLFTTIVACSGSTKKEKLAQKRMPVGNASMISLQKQETEEKKVDKIINEYKFKDDIDPVPVSEISLNEAAPDYSSPDVPDTAAYIENDTNNEEFEAKPFDPNSYPTLSDIPKKKISTNKHKKILERKKQITEQLKKKTSDIKPTKELIPPISEKSTKTEAVNKQQIAEKLKQLKNNATKEKTAVSDRMTPSAPTSTPETTIPSTKAPQTKNISTTPEHTQQEKEPLVKALPKVDNNINAPIPPMPKLQGNQPSAPQLPNINTEPNIPSPPLPTKNLENTPIIPPSVAKMPELPAIPQNTPDLPKEDAKTANKKIKVNKDMSVEIYDHTKALPTPPALPAIPTN